jgi:hypothetical protein
VRCQLPAGHAGHHQEVYTSPLAGQVTVTWEKDERKSCHRCGKRVGPGYDWEHVGDLVVCDDCAARQGD